MLGCIADDFTGGTDLSSNLVKRGFRTIQTLGIPSAEEQLRDVDAVVVALRSRTIPAIEAKALSVDALRWLQSIGCRRFYFKYCSTFDSTPQGNIGPVTDALLDALGVHALTAYVDTHADWLHRLYDTALRLYPMQAAEHCNDPVCHRITFLYALLYEHAQLNEATHSALHEMFGIANMKAFEHLAQMVRQGKLVAYDGADIYLPHLDRLAIPIAFIHGAENACFLPESTRVTFDLLRETNGAGLYSRHVIPGYGHIDCIYGKNAAQDVYPFMLHHLEGIGA